MSWHYLYVFLQSNALEAVVYGWFYREKLPMVRVLAVATLANAITHPLVFFGFMASSTPLIAAILAAEAFAVIAETCLHSYATGMRPGLTLRAALAANIVSWQMGPMLTYWLFFSGGNGS